MKQSIAWRNAPQLARLQLGFINTTIEATPVSIVLMKQDLLASSICTQTSPGDGMEAPPSCHTSCTN